MAELTISGDTHPILKDDYASEWMGIEVLAARRRPRHHPDDAPAGNAQRLRHGARRNDLRLRRTPPSPWPATRPTRRRDEPGTITVAAGVDINFLKPAFRGQVLTAVANRRASTGRSGLYDIQIYAADPDGTPAARCRRADSRCPAPPHRSPGELIAEFRGRSRTISKK